VAVKKTLDEVGGIAPRCLLPKVLFEHCAKPGDAPFYVEEFSRSTA